MKDSSTEEIENVGTNYLKDKIEVLEYENNQLKKVVRTQMAAMDQRNSEIASLVNLVKGIIAVDGADSKGEDKMAAIRDEGCANRLKEGDSSPKCDAGLELLRDLILEMSHDREVSRREKFIEAMPEEIQRMDENNREMENQLTTANEKLVVLERELVNEQKKTELLEMWARKKDNKIESLMCEVQRLVNGKTQISEEVKHLRKELAAANVKIDRLQVDNCQKEKRILEVERRLEDLANKFEERSAKLKMEGQEERLREERHSGTELCKEIEAYKQQMIAELEHSKRRRKEASKENLGTSATLCQSSFGKELVIELGRLKEQLCFRKESKTPHLGGHIEMLATEDLRQLRSSGETDRVINITECLHDKDLQEVLGSKDRGMQSLSEAIDHLLKVLRTEGNNDRAAVAEMVANLRKQRRLLGFSKEDMANKAHIDTHIHVLNKARGKNVHTQMDKILECKCQSKPAAKDINTLQNNRSGATKMIADLRKQKRFLGFTREDMALKAHLDTHIHVLNRAQGKDIQTQMNNILECMCQSKLAAENCNNLENNVLSAATQEKEVILDPKYSRDELISTQEEVLATKKEISSIEKEVLGTPKTVISSEDFILISENIKTEGFVLTEEGIISSNSTGQAAPVVPEEPCLTPQTALIIPEDLCPTLQVVPIVPEDLCLAPQAAPIVPENFCLTPQAAQINQEELLITKQRDAFHVEGAAISGNEQALRNDREALNMERLAQIREKEAFAAEREAFEKMKAEFLQEKEQFQKEREEVYKKKKGTIHSIERENVTNERELQLEKKIEELENTIKEKERKVKTYEIYMCTFYQDLYRKGLVDAQTVQNFLDDMKAQLRL
ncbi:GRIP and coiled-coil domain-containing protein 2-like [Macrobrachium nipponense]|uniref:GRIP and coiled-coil domain-containing protein 2-like n=1 Tax=Macrobrachium nipponense TaxID=159736 RepID=UPI0030C8B2E7